MAVQLSSRWSVGSGVPSAFLAKSASMAMVWRGPTPNTQVTLSERPSGWQAPHEPQPLFDQRPNEVQKNCLPRLTFNPAASVGWGESGRRAETDCELKSM